jgi:hypothetical protein
VEDDEYLMEAAIKEAVDSPTEPLTPEYSVVILSLSKWIVQNYVR